MNKATGRRRLISLDTDLLGIGPAEAEVEDLVCILGGLQVPLILRAVEDHFIIVGECYVHGIMDGEKAGEVWEVREFDIW